MSDSTPVTAPESPQSSPASPPSDSSPSKDSPPPKSFPPPASTSPPKSSSPPPSPPKDSSPPPPKQASPPPQEKSPPSNKPTSSPPPPQSPTEKSPSPPPPQQSSLAPSPPSNNPTKSSPPPPSSSSQSLSPPRSPSEKSPPSNSPDSSSSSSSKSPPSNDDSTLVPIIAGVTAGVVVVLFVLMILICVCCCKKKKKEKPIQYYANPVPPKVNNQYYDNASPSPNWYNNVPPPPGGMRPPPGGWAPSPGAPMISSGEHGSNYTDPYNAAPQSPALGFNKSTFTYDELAAATNGFSQANLLGQGGFGYVHKGTLPNGKVVAVKSLKAGSGQGEREFQAEVEIISRVHHRHLVSLVGYCIVADQRMLVYEFVPNKTLEYHLHAKGHTPVDWTKRLNIAIGSAKGLAYLHEDCHPKIIHRDIKTANILLDNNFEAMVADFGLAKLSSDNFTHVSTRIMGTFGYLAPEYASSGKLTDKSDVFSFGVMILEMITGRRPVDTTNSYMEDSLVDWARPLLTRALEDDNFKELVDARLENDYNHEEMKRMIACASASIRHSAKRRPKMSQIVRALEGDVSLEDLNDVSKATGSSTSNSTISSEFNTKIYKEEMIKHRRLALGSGEHSGATSTYGLNPSSSSSDFSAASREMK